MRKSAGIAVTVVIILLFAAAIFQVALPSIKYWVSDPVIGWKHAPNFSGTFSGPGFKTKIKFNNEGFRDIDHRLKKRNDILRIAVLGDSFVEAMQVDLDHMLTSILEKKLNSKSIKSEVMNFGVSTFGTTNEYLTYNAYVRKYRPDIVIIVFYINDFIDNDKTLSNRRACIDLMRHRPYFTLKPNGEIAVEKFSPYNRGTLKTELSKIKMLSFLRNIFYRWQIRRVEKKIFDTDEWGLYSDKFNDEIDNCVNLTKAIIRKFLIEIIEDGSIPVVCLFYPCYAVDPYYRDLLINNGFNPDKINFDKPFDIVSDLCKSLNVDVVDIRKTQLQIYKSSSKKLFFKDGHWNNDGHIIMTKAIERKIIMRFIGKEPTEK